MRAQPVLETHFLDVEIELQRLDLLRQRDARGRLVGERVAQEGRQAREHRVRRLGLLEQHQHRHAVQRVEQEERVKLVAQHRELRRLRLLFSARQIGTRSRSKEQTSELQSLMRSSYTVFCLKEQLSYTR